MPAKLQNPNTETDTTEAAAKSAASNHPTDEDCLVSNVIVRKELHCQDNFNDIESSATPATTVNHPSPGPSSNANDDAAEAILTQRQY